MSILEIHINEVKDAIVRKKLDKISPTFIFRQTIEDEIEEHKFKYQTNDLQFIISAYYINDDFFYYLERIKKYYLLTKFQRGQKKQVILKEPYLEEVNELDFTKFKKLTRTLEFKERIFDINKNDQI